MYKYSSPGEENNSLINNEHKIKAHVLKWGARTRGSRGVSWEVRERECVFLRVDHRRGRSNKDAFYNTLMTLIMGVLGIFIYLLILLLYIFILIINRFFVFIFFNFFKNLNIYVLSIFPLL